MELKTTYLRQFIIFFTVCLVFLFSAQRTLAANGAITVSPHTGNYETNQIFNIGIGIDGGGTPFNAAKATVSISSGLSVQDVTIGDCDFAFVKTPTQADPSFAGVILGGSSNACTVYTLALKAISSGTVGITLLDTAVTSYKGAVKIPLSAQYGKYTITGAAAPVVSAISSPIEVPALGTGGIKLYDIHFTLPLPKNIPPSELKVVLDPKLPQERTAVPALVPGNPDSATVTFEKVPEGVHTIATFHNEKSISKQIINVSGNNKNLAFGVSAKKPTPSWIWYLIAVAIFICLGILGIFLYRRHHISQS